MDCFFVPENLDLEEELNRCGLSYLNRSLFRDKCNYLISSLYLQHVILDKTWAEYFPVYSKRLERLLTSHHLSDVKDALLKSGIIEVRKKRNRETYSPQQESKSYRIGKRFWGCRFKTTPISNSRFGRRINTVKLEENLREIEGHSGKRLIYKSLQTLTFDAAGARRLLELTAFTKDRSENFWLNAILRLEQRYFRVSSDAQGRFYNNLTNMPRKLRPFLTYNGEPLYSIDISGSHPCIASLLYREECEEKSRYVAIVSGNTFYAFLNSRLKFPFNLEDDEVKTEFKKAVFRAIFFGSAYAPPAELWEIFVAEFPILADRIKAEKRRHQRDLAKKIQKIESDIVINSAAIRIGQKYTSGNVCMISIHDCLVTTGKHTAEFKGVLEEEYEKVLGFRPTVKIKELREEFPSLELAAAA